MRHIILWPKHTWSTRNREIQSLDIIIKVCSDYIWFLSRWHHAIVYNWILYLVWVCNCGFCYCNEWNYFLISCDSPQIVYQIIEVKNVPEECSCMYSIITLYNYCMYACTMCVCICTVRVINIQTLTPISGTCLYISVQQVRIAQDYK